jgi:hypothetical protein
VDADRFVDQVLAEVGADPSANETMCAVAFMASDEEALMSELGFRVASGNRSEKANSYFGHIVWNPWRPADSDQLGDELAEDLGADYIAVDHLAQIGSESAHGMDLTVPQLQRRFLMLYAEWLGRVRRGAEDRVWTFGFVVHPNYGADYNADLVELLDWLEASFVGQTTAEGHLIAQYATVRSVADQLESWEADHFGTSSFDYRADDPYPYTYAHVAGGLAGADFEGEVDLGGGASCYRFARDGRPVYMLWSDSGETSVDLTGQLTGAVRVVDSDGEALLDDAGAVPVGTTPILVESQG